MALGELIPQLLHCLANAFKKHLQKWSKLSNCCILMYFWFRILVLAGILPAKPS